MNVVQVLEKRLDYDRGMILLANQDKTKLQFRAGFGYTDEQTDLLTEEFQLEPEQSTSAIIVHHPQARYFNVR